ncbi:MAG: hypothetical protein ACW981_06370 [Candidatus Hodarchaeales archaeon]|jgi:hypothetical protein
MIACPNCNFSNENDDIFCSSCGYNLKVKHTSFQEPLPSIQGDHLAQYQQLEDRIKEFEGIEDEIHQAFQYHQSLKSEAGKVEVFYKKKQEDARKEFKDVEDLKKLTWKSLKSRFSGKKEELLQSEEKEYLEAINKEEQAKNDFHEIMKRVNTAHNQLTELQDLGKKRLSLDKDLILLLENVYKGGRGDEIENQIEMELERLQKERNPINTNQSQLKTAIGHLNNARDHFVEGLRKLDSAMGYSNWDTFMGGGFFVDSMKHGRVSDARNAVMQGHYSLERAYTSYPQLPPIHRAQVQEGSYFWDTFFDNIFSDMQARQRIQDSKYSVQTTLNGVNSAIDHVGRKMTDLNNNLNLLERNVIIKRKELTDRRRILIEEQIRGKKS